MKSARHLQSAPSKVQDCSLRVLHRESFPAHVPEEVATELSQRQSAPCWLKRMHFAWPLAAQRESLPKQSPPTPCVPVGLWIQRQSEPSFSSWLQRVWLLPAHRESLPSHSPSSELSGSIEVVYETSDAGAGSNSSEVV